MSTAIVPTRSGAEAAAETPGAVRRLRRRPLAVACVGIVALVVGIAGVAPIVLPDVAHQLAGDDLFAVRQGPSWRHLLGTDSLGRDVFDRLLVGTRPTQAKRRIAIRSRSYDSSSGPDNCADGQLCVLACGLSVSV